MSIRFRVTHHPEAEHAHKYRYALVYGSKVLASSEGYPTHQHVTRAIRGLWKNLAKVFGVPDGEAALVYTRDSLKPDKP